MARIDTLENFLVDVVTAIKEKRHLDSQSKILASNFDTEILQISGSGDTSDATATPNDVLYPVTAYAKNTKFTGAIIPEYASSDYNIVGNVFMNTSSYNSITFDKATRLFVNYSYNATSFTIYRVDAQYQIIENKTYSAADFGYSGKLINNMTFLYNINPHNSVLAISWGVSSEQNTSYITCIEFDDVSLDYVRYTNGSISGDSYTTKVDIKSIPNRPNEFLLCYFTGAGDGYTIYTNIRLMKYNNKNEEYNIQSVYNLRNGYGNSKWVYRGNSTDINIKTDYAGEYVIVIMYYERNGEPRQYSGVIKIEETSLRWLKVESSRQNYYFLGEHLVRNNQVFSLPNTSTVVGTSDISYTANSNSLPLGNYAVYRTNTELSILMFDTNTATVKIKQILPITTIGNFNHIDSSIGVIEQITNGAYMLLSEQASIPTKFNRQGMDYIHLTTSDNDALNTDVLLGKKAYTANGELIGIMPNNGQINITPSTSQQSIPAGYTTGGTVSAVTSAIDSNIQADNIKEGVEILGVTGTFMPTGGDATSDANLQAKYLLEGYSAVKDGVWIQGTMRNYGTTTIQRTSEVQTIPTGYYDLLTIPIAQAENLDGYNECLAALEYVNTGGVSV